MIFNINSTRGHTGSLLVSTKTLSFYNVTVVPILFAHTWVTSELSSRFISVSTVVFTQQKCNKNNHNWRYFPQTDDMEFWLSGSVPDVRPASSAAGELSPPPVATPTAPRTPENHGNSEHVEEVGYLIVMRLKRATNCWMVWKCSVHSSNNEFDNYLLWNLFQAFIFKHHFFTLIIMTSFI